MLTDLGPHSMSNTHWHCSALSHTLRHTLFLRDLSLFMSLIMPVFSGFLFWCVIVFLKPFRWFSSFLSNDSWTPTSINTGRPPPTTTFIHFIPSIPFGTNDARLCICLIFWNIPPLLDSTSCRLFHVSLSWLIPDFWRWITFGRAWEEPAFC